MCDAAIRPFPNDTEVRCGLDGEHRSHVGTLLDYAYEGSMQSITWDEGDRRNYHGEWPGACTALRGCILPLGHGGRCAQ